MGQALLRAVLPVLAALTLSACSEGGGPGGPVSVSSGDPATCPGEILDVAVSVAAWSDVVRRLGGDCATVTTVADGTGAPADVGPADREALASADLVVVNGAGDDRWAREAAGSGAGAPAVVSAAEAAGPDAAGSDPHLWYEPAVVPLVADAVTAELARLSPDAAPYFDAQRTTWLAGLQPYVEAVAAVRAAAGGQSYAATGAVFGRMAGAVGLTDVTPPGFARSLRTGDTPASDDVAALEAALRAGAADVLIRDGAAEGDLADRLQEAADAADVPVVAITSAPDEDTPFVEWQTEQLTALAEALEESGS